MADRIPLEALLMDLEDFPKRIAEEGKRTMIEETPVGPTGNLRKSIKVLEQDDRHCVIGTTLEYATHVENGHGPVNVKPERLKENPKAKLRYFGYAPGPKSIHKNDAGEVYFRRRTGKADANPFLERTADALGKINWAHILNAK